jgi:hypothetical protein
MAHRKDTTKPARIRSTIAASGDGWQIVAETLPKYGTDYIVFVNGERIAGCSSLWAAEQARNEYVYEQLRRAA